MYFFQCVLCQKTYQKDEVSYTCPDCGDVGTLDILYDYAALAGRLSPQDFKTSSEMSMWRYKALLPLEPTDSVPPLRVGWTPLYENERLAKRFGVKQLWIKDDGQNPTGSLKDRASAHVVAKALNEQIPVVATASTGNAAAALAGVCASVEGVQAVIFVPASAPSAKIAQLLIYGAKVLLIDDCYDVAFDLCTQVSETMGWYSRNTGVNPFTTEGKKTVALEIAEQLNWQMPDVVMVGVGDGSIISGVYKGFYDLLQLGWIDRIPRLIGVQAEGSSALVKAYENNTAARDMQPEPAETIADSISSGFPRDRAKALRAVRQTDGAMIAVPDSVILEQMPVLAQASGVFAEPAASAPVAGLLRGVQSGYIQPHESVVLLVTGNGLKDVKRAQEAVEIPEPVRANLDSIYQYLKKLQLYAG